MNNLRTKTKECLFHASIFQKQCSIVHLNTCRVKFISIGNYTCMCNWFGSKITHTHSIRPTHRQNVCQWSLDRKLETQSFSWNHCLFEIIFTRHVFKCTMEHCFWKILAWNRHSFVLVLRLFIHFPFDQHRHNVCQWSLDRKLETQSFAWNHCLFEINFTRHVFKCTIEHCF